VSLVVLALSVLYNFTRPVWPLYDQLNDVPVTLVGDWSVWM
jgi:hypothetical protein